MVLLVCLFDDFLCSEANKNDKKGESLEHIGYLEVVFLFLGGGMVGHEWFYK